MNEITLNITQFTQTIETLADAERGRLFLAMLEYARTGAAPELSGSERGAWGPVKAMIDKQSQTYRNRVSGMAKARETRWKQIDTDCNSLQQQTVRERESPPPAPPPKEKDIYIPPNSEGIDPLTENCNTVIDFLNKVAGTQYKHSETSRKHIRARLNDGFTVDDCKQVICKQWKAWRGTEWQKYMRPETLFNPTKFEGYLNATTPSSDGLDNLRALYEQAKKEEESETL